ncbi:MAG: T9SS type A sorting domain-containing protein [Rhodothermaceae bacterium]|nr:T9SS type A sorting domain-containing protein [Rhodothermaceae bacterium]MXZ18937.1 T9SS type A sorting domain-containing protein [Rhodothermaceae bacterium]MYC04043.1 T9SS type A sorting domain-containing protein [Rhodothermaceae bacterium]MYE62534.1 T9SS type A sorting domain-containing protein [Rhodothermaceae bacterium]MYI17862.1 T9SS type A sorting domain-containing protein [Rhodothermaceae bacterium]
MGMDPNIVEGHQKQLITALTSAPSFSLVLPFDSLFDEERGLFSNSEKKGRDSERPVSIELIYPPDFFDEIDQSPRHGAKNGFAVNAGLRIRGGWATRKNTNPKHSFRLYFRGAYGPKNLDYDLFGDEGVDEFDKFDLRTAQSNSWSLQGSPHHTFLRDVFSRDTQRDMGMPYTRSRYYHLYLNGQYWGMYQTQERADQWHGEFYIGGDKDDFDVVKHDNGHIEFSEGNQKAWSLLYDEVNQLAQLVDEQERNAVYMKLRGLNPDGSPNSDYPVLLDADNLIQYMLIIFWTANTDGPIIVGDHVTNNWIGMRDRKGNRGFVFFVHDAEFTLFPGPGTESKPHDRTGPFSVGDEFERSNPQWIHQQLMGAGHYRLRFAELAHQHFSREGALSDSSVFARWDARVNEVRSMILAEAARWGDFKRTPPRTPQDWRWAVKQVREQFLPSRTPIVIQQLRQAKRWESGRPGDTLVDAPLYGDILTSRTTNGQGFETSLEQNYPNPFNSATFISFSLKTQQHTTLTVYDLLGRKMKLLVDDRMPSGTHRIAFDAQPLVSGTYLYTLRTGNRIVTKRMILMK